jgi:hypothetical protein
MCVLGRYVVVAVACVLFVIVLQRRVEYIYYPCTHAQKKKKIALVIRGLLLYEMGGCYIWYQSGFNPATVDRQAFHCSKPMSINPCVK